MLLLHHIFRYDTVSLFLAPAGIAIILASIAPAPVFFIATSALLFELLSTLPFGSMLIIFMMPFATQWLWKSPETNLSWKYFFMTCATVTLQITFLIAIKNISHSFSLYAIPLPIASMQIICTSIASYGLAVALHELSA